MPPDNGMPVSRLFFFSMNNERPRAAPPSSRVEWKRLKHTSREALLKSTDLHVGPLISRNFGRLVLGCIAAGCLQIQVVLHHLYIYFRPYRAREAIEDLSQKRKNRTLVHQNNTGINQRAAVSERDKKEKKA